MPCVQSSIIQRQGIIDLIILPLNTVEGFNKNEKGFNVNVKKEYDPSKLIQVKALIDTGATMSGATGELMERLAIRPAGLVKNSGVHGEQLVYNYYADIVIHGLHHVMKGIELFQVSKISKNWDAIIGMDIIQLGFLSFHFPSHAAPAGTYTFCI